MSHILYALIKYVSALGYKVFYETTIQLVRSRFTALIVLLIIGLSYSCKPTKYLEGDEKLLINNKVEIKKPPNSDLPKNLDYDLSTLYKQQVNDHFLLFWSSVDIYEKNLQRLREGKKSQKWREKRGEPLAVYDAERSEETRKSMVYYLNNLGYFEAKVGYEEAIVQGNWVKVQYNVEPGPLYSVNSVNFKSEDISIDRIVKSIANKSLLKEGSPISETLFKEENARILDFMNNNGYAKMSKNHLVTTGDSTGTKVDVTIEVLAPRGKEKHTRYTVGEINVYPQFVAGSTLPIQLDTLVDGVYFKYTSKTPNVLPEVILRNIYLRTGIRYSKELSLKTEKLLANLNVFRIVTVKAVPRENDETIFDYQIYLSTRKKLSAGFDADLNQTTNTITGGTATFLLGAGLNFNIRDYNAFREGIQMSLGLRGGVDINILGITDPNVASLWSLDGALNLGLSVPRFVKWLGPYSILNNISYGKKKDGEKKRLLSNRFIQNLHETTKTTHTVKFEFSDIFDFYRLYSFEGEVYNYNVALTNKSSLNITHTGLTVFFPETRRLFNSLADSNEYLKLSFTPQLLTGVFFKNLSYSYTTGSSNLSNKWDLRWNLELSGLEIFAANRIMNLGANKDTISLFNEFEFSQFVRTEFTASQNKKLTEKTDLAFRYHVGLARPFGYSSDIPYLRQFFGGGPNSMRGWRIRELGPGAFEDNQNITRGNFFQAADFQIEANLEYRFPIFPNYYIKGALFLDAGNIWTLSEDDPRLNSQFRIKEKLSSDGITMLTPFYKQMAVSGGFGLRFDFAYFVIRLDTGIKIRNPFPVQNSYWLPDFNELPIDDFAEFFDIFNFNLAVGYPF